MRLYFHAFYPSILSRYLVKIEWCTITVVYEEVGLTGGLYLVATSAHLPITPSSPPNQHENQWCIREWFETCLGQTQPVDVSFILVVFRVQSSLASFPSAFLCTFFPKNVGFFVFPSCKYDLLPLGRASATWNRDLLSLAEFWYCFLHFSPTRFTATWWPPEYSTHCFLPVSDSVGNNFNHNYGPRFSAVQIDSSRGGQMVVNNSGRVFYSGRHKVSMELGSFTPHRTLPSNTPQLSNRHITHEVVNN